MIDLARAIDDFWSARLLGDFEPNEYRDRLTLDEAYRIQLGIAGKRIKAGERQIGWKVGLTAKALQEQFGMNEPVFACILDRQQSGHTYSALTNAGLETELCLELSDDIDGNANIGAIKQSIRYVYPSFEVIETRCDIKQLMLTIADNGQQHSIVLGGPVLYERSIALQDVLARTIVNGVEVAADKGSAVLGNPLNSILWLSRKLSQYGRQLRAGDLVMTGSIVRQVPLQPGDVAIAEFSGIGRVETRLAPA